MGLAEKRAAKDFETNRFPTLKKQISEAAKFDLPVEVQWDTMMKDDYAHMYDEAWTKVYFTPVIDALKAITIDDMGKDALKGALKKVVMMAKEGIYYGDRCSTFKDGTLTIEHEPFSNVDSVKERAEGIQKTLESAL